MTDQFDAFSEENVVPDEQQSLWFGEFLIHRGFQGIAVKGEGIVEYDATNDTHKAEIASGKKVNVCYEYQFYPMNSQFESFPRTVFKWSKEWTILSESLAEVWQLDVKTQAREFGDKLRGLTKGGQYAAWENVPTRKYKNAAGEDKQVYAQKIVALYASQDECVAAQEERYGVGSTSKVPEGTKVEALPEAQAIGFIPALARQCEVGGVVDLVKLQEKINEMPMLANLVAESKVVTDAIEAVGMTCLPF